ncbi:MAG: hypothetical protein LH629_00485 [Ignavibacteria bacterium]|nr:hypothetical protein [Ignavibacteria bacterium]
MANWCYNVISTDSNQLITEFDRISKLNQKENIGQQLFNEDEYLFDISVLPDMLEYLTKWNFNIISILKLAIKLKIDFNHSYQELGNEIFGENKSIDGRLYNRELSYEDFELVIHNEETNEYTFNCEILEDPENFYWKLLNTKNWELVEYDTY